MAPSHALPSHVDQALARGWTVLTANQRAARTLRHAFDLSQRGLGLHIWSPPAIFAWDTWTASLWSRLLLDGHTSALLLNRSQEHTFWRAILESDRQLSATLNLRPIDPLASLAAHAWTLLHAHRGYPQLRTPAETADTRAFARWAAEFDRRLSRSNYLTQGQLAATLANTLSKNAFRPLPPGLLLIGFDTRSPSQSVLLEAFAGAGTQIEGAKVPLPPSVQKLGTPFEALTPPSLTLMACEDEREEFASCARWLRTRLTDNPALRLAVITPDLESTRAQIDRTFRHILAPELESTAAPTASGPYEFSVGIPLAQTPLAAAALDILRWAAAPLPTERITALLLSPHFAPAEPPASEHLARAEFDAFVLGRQHLLQPQLSLGRLLNLASHPRSSQDLPALLNHLRALRPLFASPELTADRPHADWAAIMSEILAAAGWSSASYTDSIEFQTIRKWESALDELATLDFNPDVARVSFVTALAALERIATQTLFAPESRQAPIQIMGPLESAGSTFDGIWFLRTGDLTWPDKPSPNPLLPWRLQRDLLMPGVDPALDSALGRRITQRIAASAPEVLFSYALIAGDRHQRPSPALAGLPLQPGATAQVWPPEPAPRPIVLEILHEEPPIPPPPDQVFPGGAGILQSQAACAFRAFAEKRLRSSALEPCELGLDPRERGSLVHDILDRFWAEVETQAALSLLAPSEREGLLAYSIDQALAQHIARADPGWNLAYLESERTRLLKLLTPWLALELRRPPFAVQAREAELHDVSIGPLRLDVRVDRVDTLLTGSPEDPQPAGDIILDYKTGRAAPAEWLGERPDAPQLPLYAVISNSQNLAAVAFANIRAGEDMDLTGYEARKALPRASRLKTPSLQAQVDAWRTTLTLLAEDFHAGTATVAPKQYPSTCRYCQQRLLCRLNPTLLQADAIEDFADETDTSVTVSRNAEGEPVVTSRA